MSASISIAALDAISLAQSLDRLAEILHACVHEGASVGFVLPFGMARRAPTGATGSRPRTRQGAGSSSSRALDDDIAGTAQLDLDSMPSKRHHAEVSKVLVDPPFRRAGVARALMAEIERRAHATRPLAPHPRHRGRRGRGALPFARL